MDKTIAAGTVDFSAIFRRTYKNRRIDVEIRNFSTSIEIVFKFFDVEIAACQNISSNLNNYIPEIHAGCIVKMVTVFTRIVPKE